MNIYRLRVTQFVSIACLTLASTAPLCAQPAFDLQVTDAWIRWLPANLPSAGYMTLTNRGSMAQVLIGASSTDYGEITLHQSRRIEGMNGMVPIDSIKLAPKTSIDFARDGYHLMLMQPHRSIRAGERLAITLRFSNGQSMTIPFTIRATNPSTSETLPSLASRHAVIV